MSDYNNPYYKNAGGSTGNGNFQVGQNPEGLKASSLSLVFGVIGLFVFGLLFGILALVQAKKSHELGVPATAGTVLGWIDVIVGGFGFIVVISMFLIPGMTRY